MPFVRQPSPQWALEVPGTRWFRADLHTHTLDDHPATNLKRPPGLNGPAADSATQLAYARAFLKAAVARKVEVIGLTPHAVRSDGSDETSATWRIVEEWNSGTDDDGVPFRQKIFAVFPGFEPNLKDGQSGVHIIFLFDPEIGRDCYLRAFNAVMGGTQPYDGSTLRMSPRDFDEAISALDEIRKSERDLWSYAALAPHAWGAKGVFDAMKAQVLEKFAFPQLAALELPDDKLREEKVAVHAHIGAHIERLRLGTYHATDAYELSTAVTTQRPQIGHRITLIKLAAPTIEGLRQAFLARPRLLEAYRREPGNQEIVLRGDLPQRVPTHHPWIRSVRVSGGASFFGGPGNTTEFRFSPDLTCLIGGSMTGKSTLLDGLRVHFGMPLPTVERLKTPVEQRARSGLLAGGAIIDIDIVGAPPTRALAQRWPAQFLSQGELQTVVESSAAKRDIVYRLANEATRGLLDNDATLDRLDKDLVRLVNEQRAARVTYATTEQSFESSRQAAESLAHWKEHGLDDLRGAQARVAALKTLQERTQERLAAVSTLVGSKLGTPESVQALEVELDANEAAQVQAAIQAWDSAVTAALEATKQLDVIAGTAHGRALQKEQASRATLLAALSAAGQNAAELARFDEISRVAGQHDTLKAALDEAKRGLDTKTSAFDAKLAERDAIVEAQREIIRATAEKIAARLKERIRIELIECGDNAPLGNFVTALRNAGVSRWWGKGQTTSPAALASALQTGNLAPVGMSVNVAASFRELMTLDRVAELRALRCQDDLRLSMKLEDGSYRPIEALSGGQQRSLLLTLLLESDDPRPLVIDQPEDELDNSYLWSTVLPALGALKGKRQVIVATHNANIVVNGDADQVICLQATRDHGSVAAMGAIEEPGVRDRIVDTLDGGRAAFELRQAKYGF